MGEKGITRQEKDSYEKEEDIIIRIIWIRIFSFDPSLEQHRDYSVFQV